MMTSTTFSAPPPAAADRSDFRNIMLSGTKVGLVTGVAVLVYTALFRAIPAGLAREVVEAVVVLATATLVSFLPAQWVVARGSEGIAGAAAVGLWGTIVFTAIDIVVLRPANHLVTIYPWTWDAVGGLSTWWYLPIWWMLGTFVAWMGGMLTAGRAARAGDSPTLQRVAVPVVAGAALIAVIGRIAGCPVMLPVTAGGGFTLTLTVLAVAAVARKA
ncbi:MAG: hypothetical protein AUH78_23850 [Gemmatimonadetes bacterium 13_1_40CM_4_69_8]|nr:MAG: hypothetical protein AUH78_23850 [Gemmatimonadetes bacterium 13_1_40CM_4_69_8]